MNAGLSPESWIYSAITDAGINRLALIGGALLAYPVPHSARCDQFSDCSTTPNFSMEKLITPAQSPISPDAGFVAGAAVGASCPCRPGSRSRRRETSPEPRRHLGRDGQKAENSDELLSGLLGQIGPESGTTIHVLRRGPVTAAAAARLP